MSRIEELIAERCPDGVEFLKIGQLAQVGTGSSDRKNAVEGGEYPFYVRSKEIMRIGSYEFDEEAILIPGEGGIGEIFHYVQGRYSLHQRAYRIHFTDERINTQFAYFYFTANFKRFILQKAVSATVTSIRKPMITDFPFPVPPLEIQQEIVRVLDTFSKMEAELEAELEARKQQYEHYRACLFGSMDLAETLALSDIAEFKYGYTTKATDSGAYRFIRITDISDAGTLRADGAKFIEQTPESDLYLVQPDDLLMARTGATFGKTVIVKENQPPAVYASFLIRVRFSGSRLLPSYYWHFAQSTLYWDQANALVSSGGQPQFNANALKKVRVPIPDIIEQRRIVEILDKFDALVNDLSVGLPAELAARRQQYEYYRDKLLTFKKLEPAV